MLNHELDLHLPSSCREWVAETQSKWFAAKDESASPINVKNCFRSQLSTIQHQSPPSPLSPMGAYVIIHALLQRIYLANSLARDCDSNILPVQTDSFERALNNWRITWKASPETAHDPFDTYGSLAFSFSSTALLGIAHVRLQLNLGPWRSLKTCNPQVIAARLKESPHPQRNPHLPHALLHAVHALRISVHMEISISQNDNPSLGACTMSFVG
ncbi:uncharacterized protein LDX57_010950 [Aspergillus melleus]|uniref:uncharacterized protein n=1 Tax=Aspergillus melleus TaxID=138277 RepID=UPI001E8D4FDD|nr:uncharacterized protein LDX57_010950 [Aspergillus melleus]KAH8433314.1 hypothetical protein LDX57_010950 [Aspergillus melleus]